MKKYTITALILTLIACICAALIASVNLLTAPIIEKNNNDKKEDLCHQIFLAYDSEKSKTETDGFQSDQIVEAILAYDSNSEFLGYIYTVSGSNSFGNITLLIGISEDEKLVGVRFITNGQSFSNEAATHLDTQYKKDMTLDNILDLDLSNSDVTAGATYASKLIRSLVEDAFNDIASREKGGN